MEAKFTNGLWVVKGDEVGYISQHDDQSFGMFCPVAIVCGEKYRNLIAAAPELLEAVQRLLPDAHWAVDYLVGEPDEDEDIAFARAAIAKATGEQE